MLNDEVVNKVTDRLVRRIEQVNTYTLEQIGKVINKIGKLTPSKARQLEQILKYGGDFDKIVKELSRVTNLNVNEIFKIFEEVAKNDYDFARKFYDYRGKKFIPYKDNVALQTQVRAIATQTAQDFLTQTTMLGYGMLDKDGNIIYRGLRETYNELIDEAVLSISQGKETFQEAMYRQIKELGGGGLKVIYPSTYVDKNGEIKHNTRRLDSAVRMNMNEGIRTLHNEIQEVIGEEFGADGIEISVHGMPAIDHEEVQGRQFSKEEYAKLNEGLEATDYKGRTYTLDHDDNGSYRPISTLNCQHYTFNIVLGVSTPEYTDEELKKIREDNDKGFELDGKHYSLYEGTQLQRNIELELRKAKDTQIMAKASGNMELVGESQARITTLNKKYKELLDISGLSSKLDRAKVIGYKRTKVK